MLSQFCSLDVSAQGGPLQGRCGVKHERHIKVHQDDQSDDEQHDAQDKRQKLGERELAVAEVCDRERDAV